MRRNRTVTAIGLLAVVFFGCKKEDDGPPQAPGPTTAPATTSNAAAAGDAPASVGAGAGAGATGNAEPGGSVKNAVQDPVALACAQKARDVPGNKGTSYYMRCPAGCKMDAANVWGTDIYTDDSSVCVAARHAGALGDPGGVVLVTWAPAQATYLGSLKNGVTTAEYGGWARSFVVQSVDERGKPTSPAPRPMAEGSAKLSCSMTSGVLPGPAGTRWRVLCPAGCSTGSFWGSDIYTGDSRVCLAAMHAGVITAANGGEATVTITGPQASFAGAERNGFTSQAFGKYDTSYRVSR